MRAPIESAFLADIAARPEANVPRLVYADWLEEVGETDGTHAELIRLQYALAVTPPHADGRVELQARETVLLKQEESRWCALLAARGVRVSKITFERGFPEQVAMSMGDFVRQADLLSVLTPVTSLQVVSPAGRDPDQTQADLRLLTGCPHLRRFKRLSIVGQRFGDEGASVLAQSPFLAGLDRLIVSANLIGARGAEALASSPNLGRLSLLDLFANRIGDEGVWALAGRAAAVPLRSLNLGQNGIGDAGAAALAASPGVSSLEVLGLARNGIRSPGAVALASSPYLGNLRELRVAGNDIGPDGARALIESCVRRVVTGLDLQQRGT